MIKIPQTDGDGTIAMAIDSAGGRNKFYIEGENIPGTSGVLSILRTIYFRKRHDSINRFLALGEFKPILPWGQQHAVRSFLVGNGKRFFRENCASSHSRFKTLTGPPLSAATMKEKTPEWMYRFLTHKSGRMKDPIYNGCDH